MIYKPKRVKVKNVKKLVEGLKLIRVKSKLNPKPGQFLQVYIPNIGECPISSASYNKNYIDFLINTLKELLNKEISDDSSRELIFELYKNPVNYGFIPKEKITNISHMYNPLCGDQIGMQLSLTNGKVNDIKFQGKGCAISVASSSIITDLIKTKKLTKEEILNLNNEDILSMLNIPISSVRLKCALLPLEAVKKAIENDI